MGVEYGSPVGKVRELLLKAANDNKQILSYNKNQIPIVFFEDFGDSALIFRLSYWIAVHTPLDIKQVSSDLRFEINKLFKDENIIIPFNQSDLHIKEPLKVQWSSSGPLPKSNKNNS